MKAQKEKEKEKSQKVEDSLEQREESYAREEEDMESGMLLEVLEAFQYLFFSALRALLSAGGVEPHCITWVILPIAYLSPERACYL